MAAPRNYGETPRMSKVQKSKLGSSKARAEVRIRVLPVPMRKPSGMESPELAEKMVFILCERPGMVEILSFKTKTVLMLPQKHISLLIEVLKSFRRKS